jgi:chloramphenicol 3-O-phosphotransferase
MPECVGNPIEAWKVSHAIAPPGYTRLVILTGASGSGKTTIADGIKTTCPGLVEVLHFDQISVPSCEVMVSGWGSSEAWQRAMTLEWMARIAATNDQGVPVLFEGQTQLAFLREALDATGLTNAHVILVDCDDATRAHRLTLERKQPELVNERMMDWAGFLRREAHEGAYEVLDTAAVPLVACIQLIRERLGL